MSEQPTQPPRFLEQMANAIRLRRMSYRTEQAYVDWAKRFILFHHKRHPKDMGAPEIEAFLTHLVNDRNVAPSTQNQALHALLFVYREVLQLEVPRIAQSRRPRRQQPARPPRQMNQASQSATMPPSPRYPN